MHILISLHRFELGGAERQALYLAKGLIEKGYKVSVVAFGNEGGLAWEWFKEAGIHIIAIGFSEKLLLERKGWRARYLYWKYSNKLINTIIALKVDVIFPFTYAPNVIFGLLWKKMGAIACYWNQRDGGLFYMGSKDELSALQNCVGIISNSNEGKFFLEKVVKSPIRLIHNGVEEIICVPRSFRNEVIRVIMVANLHSFKDHLTLLKAWKVVISKCKCQLILAGKDGDMGVILRDYVRYHHLVDSVVFAGHVNNVNELLCSCDISVFSSVKEGVPNGILESMAAGLPLVATRIEGSKEALGEDYPFLCEPLNVDDMAGKLISLIENNETRISFGQKNKARVMNLFAMTKMIDEYAGLCRIG